MRLIKGRVESLCPWQCLLFSQIVYWFYCFTALCQHIFPEILHWCLCLTFQNNQGRAREVCYNRGRCDICTDLFKEICFFSQLQGKATFSSVGGEFISWWFISNRIRQLCCMMDISIMKYMLLAFYTIEVY